MAFFHIYKGMKLFQRSRQSKELKRLVKANAESGQPLSVMEDAVFKTMLNAGTEDSNIALRRLLSACIGREVRSAQVVNNDLIPAHLAGKAPRLDVNIIFNDGESANLEMQIERSDDDLKTRAAIIAAMLLAGQSKRGKDYRDTKRVYQIFFLNCELFPESTVFPRRYHFREAKEHDILTETVEIIFYEMPKLEHKVQEILVGKMDLDGLPEDEKWCMYMKWRHERHAAKLVEQLRQEEGIMRAENSVNGITRDYLKYMREMAKEKARLDRGQMIYNLKKKAREEGHAEGHAEGLAEGIALGKVVSLAEGQSQKAIEIARRMKVLGRPVDEIAEFTGLSVETIEKECQ